MGCEYEVQKALKDEKIAPINKSWAREFCQRDWKGFQTFLERVKPRWWGISIKHPSDDWLDDWM